MVGWNVRGCNDGKAPSVGTRLALTLFLLLFFFLGSLFEVFVAREFGRALGQRFWAKTPCTIVASEVQERGGSSTPFAFTVSYRFSHAGQAHTGATYKRNYSASSTYSEAQELAQKYPVGLATFCYVNPKNPGEVVLQRNSLAFGLVLLFPLIFVLIGAGGIYFVWRPSPPEAEKPIATAILRKGKDSKGKNRYALAALLALFAVAGGVMLYPLGIRPIARTVAARSWLATPCKVLRAEVRNHSSDDGTTYSVYVLYQYEFHSQTYKSDRYNFVGGSSSGYQGKARTVEQYRAAAHPVCYVDPHNPAQAVLQRGFQAGLLIVLVPLVFLLIGVGGAYGVLKHKSAPVLPEAPVMQLAADGLVVLRPKFSPLVKLFGAVLLAIVCNLVSGLMLSELVGGLHRGHLNWTLLLMLMPFGAIGMGTVVFVGYRFLALFNPRPTLELSSNVIPLGGAAELLWRCSGRTSRLDEFTVTLRGVEEARYRRGTTTYTDRNTFYEMELYRTSEANEIASGQVGFVLPLDTMHSFEAGNNKILWNLDIHGSIRHWPDVKESFRITVTPRTV